MKHLINREDYINEYLRFDKENVLYEYTDDGRTENIDKDNDGKADEVKKYNNDDKLTEEIIYKDGNKTTKIYKDDKVVTELIDEGNDGTIETRFTKTYHENGTLKQQIN